MLACSPAPVSQVRGTNDDDSTTSHFDLAATWIVKRAAKDSSNEDAGDGSHDTTLRVTIHDRTTKGPSDVFKWDF